MSWDALLITGVAWLVGYVGGFAQGVAVAVKEQVAERFFNPFPPRPMEGKSDEQE